MKTGAVIIASSAQWDNYSLQRELLIAQAKVDNLLQLGIREIIVIADLGDTEIKKALRRKGVVYIDRNQNHSPVEDIKAGINYLGGKCNRIFFTNKNSTIFSAHSVSQLISAPGTFTMLSHCQKGEFPFAVSAPLFAKILSIDGIDEISDMLDALDITPETVVIEEENESVLFGDAQSPKENSLVYGGDALRPLISVKLANSSAVIGPGFIMLLKQIQTFGSVREACKKTTISYSKSWTMIRAVEESLGTLLVLRSQGGVGGGRSSLTLAAVNLINKYELYEAQVTESANKIFKTIFK